MTGRHGKFCLLAEGFGKCVLAIGIYVALAATSLGCRVRDPAINANCPLVLVFAFNEADKVHVSGDIFKGGFSTMVCYRKEHGRASFVSDIINNNGPLCGLESPFSGGHVIYIVPPVRENGVVCCDCKISWHDTVIAELTVKQPTSVEVEFKGGRPEVCAIHSGTGEAWHAIVRRADEPERDTDSAG